MATVWVAIVLLALPTSTLGEVDTALTAVTVADDGASVTEIGVAALFTPGGVAVAVAVAVWVEFDVVLAGVEVACGASGVGVAGWVLGAVGSTVSPEAAGSVDLGGVSTLLVVPDGDVLGDAGAVGASDSVLVCAPPLLLTVTPVPTCMVEDVAPDVPVVVVVVVVPPPVGVDPVLVAVESAPVVTSVEADEVAEPEDGSEDEASVSAEANPHPVDIARTSQAASAIPPYPPTWAARERVGLA